MKYEIGKTYENKNFNKNKKQPAWLNDNDVVLIRVTNWSMEKQLAKDVEWKLTESFSVIQYEADYLKEQREIEQADYITKFKETYYEKAMKLITECSKYWYVNVKRDGYYIDNEPSDVSFLPSDISDLTYYITAELKVTIEDLESAVETEKTRLAKELELIEKKKSAKDKLLSVMSKEELEVLGIK